MTVAADTSVSRRYFKGWRLGCLWFSVLFCGFWLVVVPVAIGSLVFLASIDERRTSMPAFLNDAPTSSSTQVYAHPEPGLVVIFYGSSDSFEVTRAHYRRAIEERGFQFDPLSRTDSSTADRYNKYGRQTVNECVTVSVFTGTEREIIDHSAEIELLHGYPYAYVVTYGHPCGS